MAQTPPTLLNRLREAPEDADAWRHFDAIYRPLLTAWLRRYALQPHDSDDLVQDILQAVAGELPHFHYDPVRGAFPRLAAADHGQPAACLLAARKRNSAAVEPVLG